MTMHPVPFQPPLPIVLVAGPTGVGKTSLAIRLAKRLETEIINADSMQVYRFMDIGTAKPTVEEQREVRHHLLDLVSPDEPFDASRYMEMARPVVDSLHQAGKAPVVVGGTGLYMKALTKGICPGAPTSAQVRAVLIRELAERGLHDLHRELSTVDPTLGGKLHPNDRQRILRALEVFRLTGKPLSFWQGEHRFADSPYAGIGIFLHRERSELYERIDRRVLQMMKAGFVAEVEKLLGMGYGAELKPMQSLGYKQLVRHLSGEYSLDAAVHEIQRETRHYAKRQMTWFRADPEFQRFHAEDREKILSWIDARLRSLSEDPSIP